jgi:hypothetical protein
MQQMILPTRLSLAVAEACGKDVGNTPVFVPNGDTLARIPMREAVLMTRAMVAQEDSARRHRMLEEAARLRR